VRLTETPRPWVFLGVSLALHAALALWTRRAWHLVPDLVPRGQPPRSVRVTLREKPKPAPKPAAAELAAPASPRPRPPAAQPRQKPPAPAPGGLTSEALLPDASWSFAEDGEAGSTSGTKPGTAPPSSAVQGAGSEVAGKLDIPLFLREVSGNAKAGARLVRDEGAAAGWRFDWVDGDPYLRAVLFEALRAQKNQRVVLDLLTSWERTDVTIRLKQRTVVAHETTDKFREDLTFGVGTIEVTRTVFTGPSVARYGGGGIPLPDEEAKRAKRRDRGQLRRLEESPAFNAPIRDRAP
jgi:hypothetical protein